MEVKFPQLERYLNRKNSMFTGEFWFLVTLFTVLVIWGCVAIMKMIQGG